MSSGIFVFLYIYWIESIKVTVGIKVYKKRDIQVQINRFLYTIKNLQFCTRDIEGMVTEEWGKERVKLDCDTFPMFVSLWSRTRFCKKWFNSE